LLPAAHNFSPANPGVFGLGQTGAFRPGGLTWPRVE
jgi:hypothetical protein